VQVLNGVGVPGVGRQVDEAIAGLGLRITLTENARSFDFLDTQIVIYDETPELLAAARQVREAMGVGTILVSRQPQSVVDLTIVVGADFLGITPESALGPRL
jgi:polyisoprenyl-teichoic acid--peptidoglycan teichoic acid transferase